MKTIVMMMTLGCGLASASAANGKTLWDEHYANCHGKDGKC